MLMTILLANKYKIANHYMDPEATYISSLGDQTISTKKGIATDTFKFTVEKDVIDFLGETFTYLCYDTPAKVYLDGVLIISGYVTKLSTTAINQITIDVSSIMKWQMAQFLSPAISGLCQNQVYSENCGLIATDYSASFTTVEIDCFTGSADISISGGVVTLGGNATASSIFSDLDMWWNAIVIIDGVYRTTVASVTDDKIYFGINYLDMMATTTTLTVYLKCDKTYGECFARFSNTKNFWGFANTGNKVQTFDIFSASNLTFCGDELQEQAFEPCDTDFNIFGINIGEDI